MRLLVLGASGGIGRWLTRLAAERQHQVTALARPGSAFSSPVGIEVRAADVLDPAVVEAAVAGHDVILSCLGLRRAGRSPWARLLSPLDLTQRVARNLVGAMQRHSVPRVIAVSAGGVGDSFEQLSWAVKRLVSSGNVAVAYRDLAAMEAVLEDSGRDWLVVRPVTLTDGPPTGRGRPVRRYRLTSTIRRSDVATWMLNAVERRDPFIQRRVLLGS